MACCLRGRAARAQAHTLRPVAGLLCGVRLYGRAGAGARRAQSVWRGGGRTVMKAGQINMSSLQARRAEYTSRRLWFLFLLGRATLNLSPREDFQCESERRKYCRDAGEFIVVKVGSILGTVPARFCFCFFFFQLRYFYWFVWCA